MTRTELGPDTDETATERPPAQETAWQGRTTGLWWRGLAGALAAGLVALALLVLGAALLVTPGPGLVSVIAHPVAALIALAAQWVVDRKRGTPAGVAVFVVLADAALVLCVFWWF